MIFLDVTGRCGNQLFQYAFARKLIELDPSQQLHICFYNVERWRLKTGDDSFSDQLKHLNVLPYTSSIEQLDYFTDYASKRQKKAWKRYTLARKIAGKLKIKKIYSVALHRLNANNIYREDECKDNVFSKSLSENILAKGYFENKKYFDDIRPILLKEFTPKYPKPHKNDELYKIIENRISICVSFRVWSEVSETVAAQRDVCGKDYYEKAIEQMHNLYPDCVFVIFSNDIAWVKDHFDFKYETVFEDGTDEVWEKLRLMYSCKHFIIAPSTFAWWVQYLSRNPDKKVIAPHKWYNDENLTSYLLDDEWIKI